nr:HET-C-related protein [uncultured Pseudomonas sp.]
MAYQTAASVVDTSPYEHIQSTFALDTLTQLAKRISAEDFTESMVRIFGEDIPAPAYTALRERLIAGKIISPEILIHNDDYTADYDNRERLIRIHSSVVADAFDNPETGKLADVLLHEFGHYIDNILRHDFLDRADAEHLATDAKGEEGLRFSYWMALLGHFDRPQMNIATCRYSPWNKEFDIVADGPAVRKAILGRHNESSSDVEHHHLHPDREAFEAGEGSELHMTHLHIEHVLVDLVESRYELEAIYFGNWLRDHSQILDPKIVRAAQMPKNFPDVLSRDALTRIVDVLSMKQFMAVRQGAAQHFTVTPERLGVYRPSEHIDNPKTTDINAPDPATRDPQFEPAVLAGSPLLDVDFASSMKRYIKRSEDFMASELRNAMVHQRTPEGLRALGSALHVLEDFFAHSNFVELALIKNGHPDVLPWTSPAECKAGLPLVTGMFGPTDAMASLTGPLSDIMFSTEDVTYQPTKPGDRSLREQILLVLLEEHHNPRYLEIYQAYLRTRDTWTGLPFVEFLQRCSAYLQGASAVVGNATGIIMKDMFKLLGENIDDWQTRYGEDPHENGSTDPTHTQLAKDHAEHPLHLVAASLASHAVEKVAREVFAYWSGDHGVDPEAVARSFFKHPQDSDWQDTEVTSWAMENPEALRRAASKTELFEMNRQLAQSGREALDQLERDGVAYLTFMRGEFLDPESPLWFIAMLTPTGPLAHAAMQHLGLFRKPMK